MTGSATPPRQSRSAAPPAVDGTVSPRGFDRIRIAWWQLRSAWVMGFRRHRGLPGDRRIVWVFVATEGVLALLTAALVRVFAPLNTALICGAIVAACLPFLVFAIVAASAGSGRRHRWYMTETRDAAVKISVRSSARGSRGEAAGTTWLVSDYCVQHIGGQSAEHLRTLLVGPLVRAVDDVDAAALIHAASPLHARLYRSAVDGFVDVGPAWPRGRMLYRARRSDRPGR